MRLSASVAAGVAFASTLAWVSFLPFRPDDFPVDWGHPMMVLSITWWAMSSVMIGYAAWVMPVWRRAPRP